MKNPAGTLSNVSWESENLLGWICRHPDLVVMSFFAGSTVERERSEVADVYSTTRLDGSEFPRGSIQEDDAQHQRESDRCVGSGHGETSRACRTTGQYGAVDRYTESTRLDVADCTRA